MTEQKEKKPKSPSVLKCPQHHKMLRVARALWLCDQCRYATGDMQHLKGVVDEAFEMLKKAGGIEAIRARNRVKNKAKKVTSIAEKAYVKEIYDTYGYYEPVTYGEHSSGD
jgi:phosphoserine aminotransferase